MNLDSAELKKRIERFQTVRDDILGQVRQVIVGQEEVLDQILTALFVGGHCLITGLPGTAKTLMVRTIAQTLGLVFKRIQFTPDLMPSDITGTDIIEEDPTTGHRRWTFVPGPDLRQHPAGRRNQPHAAQDAIGAARSHAGAFLHGARQSLQAARAVLRAGHAEPDRARRHLSAARSAARPLPLQYRARLPERRGRSEGGGPDHHHARRAGAKPVTNAEEILDFQQLVRMVPIAESLARYVVELVRATRHNSGTAPDFVKKYVNYGASVRAAQFIVLAAKARALARRRYHVAYEDITGAGHPRAAPPHPAELPRRIGPHRFGRNPAAAARAHAAAQREPDACSAFSIPRCSPASPASTWSPRPWSTASSPACTARPTSASARSSPNIAPTLPATICATWIGTSSPAPSAPT